MGLTATYGSLLKRYLAEGVIENEFTKMSYIWQNCQKDKSYRGGTGEMPLVEAGFSSVQFGSLASASDIAEAQVAMGTFTMKELFGSILVREADLYKHADMEQSYLSIMPERLNEFVKYMQELVSVQVLAGSRLDLATANGDASGNITVSKPHLFRIGMKVTVDDDNSSAVSGYIRAININTGVLTIYDARSGGSVVDLSGYTTAQNAIVQVVGQASESFTSLKSYILPAAQGGSASAYGLTKADYTVLQSLEASGSAWTANTILDDLLTAYYTFTDKRGNIFPEIYVGSGIMKNIAKVLATTQRATIMDKKAGYGWNSVNLISAEGEAKIVCLRDMPRDVVYFGDMKKVKFCGAEPFKKKMYDDKEFFMVRETTGVSMITDIALRGEFTVNPSQWGAVYAVAADAYT
jgi:hypothetical protein